MDHKRVKPAKVPVYRDSGFRLDNAGQMKKAFEQEMLHRREPDLYIYSRYRNPTVVAVEEQMMDLERCRWALLTQSGMAAIDTALSVFQEKGKQRPWLFFSEIYGGTNSFIDQVLINRRGLDIHRFTPAGDRFDLAALEKTVRSLKPHIIYFEVITNPMLMVCDAETIIGIGRKHGCTIIIDNTFATPYLWNPLSRGADLVIHSATKYLAGHGDITAGVVCGNDRTLEKKAIRYRKYVGHMLSPDDAYRLGVQLRTFPLRMEKHCANAAAVAEILQKHPAVEKVLYPGLPSHPTRGEAVRLFGKKGAGGMITFDMAGKNEKEKTRARDRFIRHVQNEIPIIPSLGDVETTLLPIEPVWGDKYPFPGMIRLSVGIEPVDTLTDWITGALNSI